MVFTRPLISLSSSLCTGFIFFEQVFTGFSVFEQVNLWPLSLYGSRWALLEDSEAGQKFTWSKTWCDRQQLWKAVITRGYGYQTQHSYPRSRLITLKKTRGEIWPKRKWEETTKNYQDEDKKSAMNKKKVFSD